MTNINLLAEQIRKDGLDSGWTPVKITDWATSNYKVPCYLALIHSEVVEAHDEVADTYLIDVNHVALGLEFADIHIRTLDLAGGVTDDFEYYAFAAQDDGFTVPDIGADFLKLHGLITTALEAFRKNRRVQFLSALGELYFATQCIAVENYDVNMGEVVDQKMAYNRTRSSKHGGKRV